MKYVFMNLYGILILALLQLPLASANNGLRPAYRISAKPDEATSVPQRAEPNQANDKLRKELNTIYSDQMRQIKNRIAAKLGLNLEGYQDQRRLSDILSETENREEKLLKGQNLPRFSAEVEDLLALYRSVEKASSLERYRIHSLIQKYSGRDLKFRTKNLSELEKNLEELSEEFSAHPEKIAPDRLYQLRETLEAIIVLLNIDGRQPAVRAERDGAIYGRVLASLSAAIFGGGLLGGAFLEHWSFEWPVLVTGGMMLTFTVPLFIWTEYTNIAEILKLRAGTRTADRTDQGTADHWQSLRPNHLSSVPSLIDLYARATRQATEAMFCERALGGKPRVRVGEVVEAEFEAEESTQSQYRARP